MGFRTWLYHNDHEAQIFDSDEVPELEKQGWCDSPAKLHLKVRPEKEYNLVLPNELVLPEKKTKGGK